MRRINPLAVVAVLAMPVLILVAMVGLFVGIALKVDVPTAMIVVFGILLADIMLDDVKKKGGVE